MRYISFKLAFMAVVLALAGTTFTACEDDIEITNGITKTPHSQNPIFIVYSSFTNPDFLDSANFIVLFHSYQNSFLMLFLLGE